MTTKLNIFAIVSKHLKTLKSAAKPESSLDFWDVVVFYILPASVAGLLVFKGYLLNDTTAGVLLAAFAILTGFLFNLLVFLFDLIGRDDLNKETDTARRNRIAKKKILLEETFANISYCVLVGIFLSFSLICGLMEYKPVNLAASSFSYFAAGNFMLTLLMILKRFHVLLAWEVDESKKEL